MNILISLLLAMAAKAPVLPPVKQEPPLSRGPALAQMTDEIDPGFTHRERPPIAGAKFSGYSFTIEWPAAPPPLEENDGESVPEQTPAENVEVKERDSKGGTAGSNDNEQQKEDKRIYRIVTIGYR